MARDIRWEQRFANYRKALKKLSEAVNYIQLHLQKDDEIKLDDVLDEMIKEGLIQRFEYTHELAWNLMKDYASYQGNSTIGGSRDATREAFQLQLIEDGKVWMDMIGSRNKTSHTDNEETADEIYLKILEAYYPAFLAFDGIMELKLNNGNNDQFD
ncbi:nucleotidyltransferase substrate binding protein, HI0074 family [Belliella baltica DSM 15883]|uniref:Nucleotidyltransferase substrate binding protein, HI0074 family n=1 Tax=Belliella baltica (strain DSM 15883 / CIP 108006 / LMG 21964 / BA134) TaxID=866536 RepID=I3Z481_BELBD|nr:nucleotidyltransferase substrate binding protein [Belliella baltica]AFL84049.1 nucleotidyltransferase substrate binding protein, HI0074 family [Belliella baltica DSM 15883]